jgi:hypothetical protein
MRLPWNSSISLTIVRRDHSEQAGGVLSHLLFAGAHAQGNFSHRMNAPKISPSVTLSINFSRKRLSPPLLIGVYPQHSVFLFPQGAQVKFDYY